MTKALLHLAMLTFLPLIYSTVKSVSREKLANRVFVKALAKEYLRTLPTIAILAIPLLAMPQFTRAYVIAIHAIFMWLVIMELGHIYLFSSRMGLNTFYSLFVTNLSETTEYIRNNQTRSQWVIILAMYFLPFSWLWTLTPITFASDLSRLVLAIICVLAIIPVARTFPKRPEKAKMGYVANPFLSVFYHYYHFRRHYGALKEQIKNHSAPPFATISSLLPNDEKQTYVICIGESATREHFEKEGYPRDTNEFTSSRGDVLYFSGVSSQFAQTLPSLEKTITFATCENPDELLKKGSIVDYFSQAGFKTFWLSNQYALEDTAITAMSAHADVQKCCNFSAMKGFETGGYDESLLPEFEKALADVATKKVIFLHMIGSHAAYVNRYPAKFRHFTDVPPGKEYLSRAAQEMVNTYDDSIRYTDWIITEFIKRLEIASRDSVASLLYFADHGEDVYETTKDKILCHSQLANRPMTAVPVQLWMSRKFRESREDFVSRSRNAKETYRLEDMIHFMIDLAGLTNEDFDIKKSLFRE